MTDKTSKNQCTLGAGTIKKSEKLAFRYASVHVCAVLAVMLKNYIMVY